MFDSQNQIDQIQIEFHPQLCALAEVPHGRNVARDNRVVVRNFSSGPGGFG